MFLVALAAAIVAAGIAWGVELSSEPAVTPSAVSSPPLPATFEQAGFVDHAVRRTQSAGFGADRRSGQLTIAPSTVPLYVVVQCDTGRVTVATSVLTSAQPCTGKPVGVVALAQVRRPTRLTVTVSRQQQAGWAVATYR